MTTPPVAAPAGPGAASGPPVAAGRVPARPGQVAAANLLLDFGDLSRRAIAARGGAADHVPGSEPESFAPGYALPDLDEAAVRDYFSVATATWRTVAQYGGHRIHLLDLTGNPATHTTKTFASLLIVARAVEFVRRTGEPVMIFSPTSANKGVALRDAVLRALDAGLVAPDQLRVVTLAPVSCRAKLRASRLSGDPHLRRLNPQLVHAGTDPEEVKALGRRFVTEHARALRARGTNVWFSLDLENYLVADMARAFFEESVAPTDAADRPRVHAHAVSSAFGLLGYHAGRAFLEGEGRACAASRPASLLVQHLGTPDMVLNLLYGDFDRGRLPAYALDPRTGMYHAAGADPHFPPTAHDPGEVLDPTFYTRRPATSPAMNEIIARYGGDGIVVSLAECVERYPLVRMWLADSAHPLPADFRRLREWSTVMAFTGVLNAIDRGLLGPDRDVVVHGTGCYTTADFDPLDTAAMVPVGDVDDIAAAVG